MYCWNPGDYARHSESQKEWARELMGKLNLRGDERVLDIGCGDGSVTAEIARLLVGGSVVGIDSSPQMIDFARKNFMDRFSNLAFHCSDVREMTFDREFDLAFSNAALHWVPDHLPVLRRIRRSLGPSGKVLFQMAGKGNAATVMEAAHKVLEAAPWHTFFQGFSFPYSFYGDEEYRGLVKTAGFAPGRVELVPKVMSHRGRAGLSGWIRTTWLPYTQRLPEEMRDRFVEEVVTLYERAHPADEEGCFHVMMVRLEVEAVNTGGTKTRALPGSPAPH